MAQERAWYDSHRASLVPEPDAETVFEEVRRGSGGGRPGDRGLTVRHLAPFFNPSSWTGFDDSDSVHYLLCFYFLGCIANINVFIGVLYALSQSLQPSGEGRMFLHDAHPFRLSLIRVLYLDMDWVFFRRHRQRKGGSTPLLQFLAWVLHREGFHLG